MAAIDIAQGFRRRQRTADGLCHSGDLAGKHRLWVSLGMAVDPISLAGPPSPDLRDQTQRALRSYRNMNLRLDSTLKWAPPLWLMVLYPSVASIEPR